MYIWICRRKYEWFVNITLSSGIYSTLKELNSKLQSVVKTCLKFDLRRTHTTRPDITEWNYITIWFADLETQLWKCWGSAEETKPILVQVTSFFRHIFEKFLDNKITLKLSNYKASSQRNSSWRTSQNCPGDQSAATRKRTPFVLFQMTSACDKNTR